MAMAVRYVCGECGYAIEAWDEGNPYYIDGLDSKKKYAYHPDPMRELCVGVDSPHLCLACGYEFMVDSEDPISNCPKCGADRIKDTFHLDGQTCPFCKKGKFELDTDFRCIS